MGDGRLEATIEKSLRLYVRHVDIAHDHSLAILEALHLLYDLPDLRNKGLTRVNEVGRALSISARNIDVTTQSLRRQSADNGAQIVVLPGILIASR